VSADGRATVLPADAVRAAPAPEILAGPLQGGGALVRDYLAGAAALEPFFTGHPGDIDAYRRKAAEVDERLDAGARSAAAPAIVPLGDAAGRLERILAGDGYFVTTGQQPALFGGPLYTLYKVLGAIRLAETLERELGRSVLALFWIGADDHDWDEANHVSMLDPQGYVQRLEVRAPAHVPPRALGERVWGPDIERVVGEAAALLEGSESGAAVARHIRRDYTPGRTVADSFTATMELLLAGRRVAIVNSAHPAVRRAAVPVLLREARHGAENFEALSRHTARLAAAGYGAQVALDAGASNLMLHGPDGRERLVRSDRGWRTRRRGQTAAPEALLARIAAEPEAFSANVLLRPVVESALFPTIAYVAGPGELGYFAQIGCLFRAHGILAPIVAARPSVVVVELRVRRTLVKRGLEPADFRRPIDELVGDVIRREVPPAASAALERIRRMLHDLYGDVMAATDAIDPTLRGPLTAARNWSTVRALEAEKRIVRHLKRRNEVLVEQLRRVSASLHPDNGPQERTLNVLPWVAAHGLGVVGAMESALDARLNRVAEWNGPACE
jgi:bacillithiol synthase